MNLFINPKDTISFDVYVAVVDDKLYANADKEELLKENKNINIKEDQIVTFTFTFKKPSYKDNIDIVKRSGGFTSDGETIEFDASSVRYERFVSLLKSWTLVNNKGELLPATKENVDMLHPTLAAVILTRMEEIIG